MQKSSFILNLSGSSPDSRTRIVSTHLVEHDGQFFKTELISAEVAHLVEHDLAKVGVAGSSPVFRS
jgi:hypothetical protein